MFTKSIHWCIPFLNAPISPLLCVIDICLYITVVHYPPPYYKTFSKVIVVFSKVPIVLCEHRRSSAFFTTCEIAKKSLITSRFFYSFSFTSLIFPFGIRCFHPTNSFSFFFLLFHLCVNTYFISFHPIFEPSQIPVQSMPCPLHGMRLHVLLHCHK